MKLKLKEIEAYFEEGRLCINEYGLQVSMGLRQAEALKRWLQKELKKEQEKRLK